MYQILKPFFLVSTSDVKCTYTWGLSEVIVVPLDTVPVRLASFKYETSGPVERLAA